MSIVTSRWSHLSHIVHHSIGWCARLFLSTVVFTLLRYADKRIVSIMKVFIERNNLQLELIWYSKKMLILSTLNFAKRRSLVRLAVASECMARLINNGVVSLVGATCNCLPGDLLAKFSVCRHRDGKGREAQRCHVVILFHNLLVIIVHPAKIILWCYAYSRKRCVVT